MHLTRFLASMFAGVACIAAPSSRAAGVPGQGTWETTLQARDLDGNGTTDAFYDTTLDITWLRDANANGVQGWTMANVWADNLVVGGYGGWRLPTMLDTGPGGCDYSYAGTDCGVNVQTKSGDPSHYEIGQIVYSEMAHLFYVTLGNKGYFDTSGNPQAGYGLTNTANFQNLQADHYWYGLEADPVPGRDAWVFYPHDGYQHTAGKDVALYAMAVHDGDVIAVPEPAGNALLLSGLAIVVAAARRRFAGM